MIGGGGIVGVIAGVEIVDLAGWGATGRITDDWRVAGTVGGGVKYGEGDMISDVSRIKFRVKAERQREKEKDVKAQAQPPTLYSRGVIQASTKG